ncbi:DNA mismatch repair protein [Suhomyces tanzawaensis NRRL Y-17324]|uniref:DNA mismatch repair protein n=1 Tax=Suhomyces tanzawaensis NRRL Y-17324 TaxID=984487 RepID=A0A1E4SB22_9ASCO|nr:DNA mismatch repair protein [Suhomyces tanzawaensis NRRL Y-17324]ODV76714.1 DNA mismatch repair protein [Suhomyces tanzawaensis NRRL Y-17324]
MSSTRPDLKFTDTVDERLYYRKYASLPPKDASTIRIIDHNNKDYFTVLDQDADLIADSIYKTQSVIKYNNSNKNRYVTISPQVFTNNVLRFCIIERHLKVEVYSNKTFELICVGTPGNLESLANEYGVNLEGMFQDCSNPIVGAIKFQQAGAAKKIGVCFVDNSDSRIHMSEFDDNDLFSNLESLILQVGVKEIVLPSNYQPGQTDNEVTKLYQVLDKIGGIVVSTVKSSFFSSKDIEQDLAKIVVSDTHKEGEETNIELILASKGISSADHVLSLSCCNALINYLELLGSEVSSSFTIDQYNLTSFMKLDSSTMKALNIFPASSAPSAAMSSYSTTSTVSSIFELLNKCKTTAGSRLLSQWLKQPLTNLTKIEERQQLVHHLIEDTNLRIYVSQDWLPQVPDIKRLTKKISNGLNKSVSNENKKLEDVIRLYQLVLVIPNLVEMLKMTAEELKETNTDESTQIAQLVEQYWLNPITNNYTSLLKFKELIETTIDLSPLESTSTHDLLNTDFNIKPEFDESLIEINDKLQGTLAEIKNLHNEVADDLNIDLDKKLKLEKHVQHGWCFRVTRNDSVVLRNTGNKYKQLQTVKAGVFFTTTQLSSLSEAYLEASAEYNQKQRELIKEILSITLTYNQVFLNLSLSIANLDVLNSFANVAIFAPTPFARPKLHPLALSNDSPEFANRRIQLEQSRHPILEVQDDINFIANDVHLSNAPEDKGKAFAIITGPNMGGKSTYIRQIGVISLMGQVGSFIPVSEENATPELPIFDAILSRIGAGDSQLKGLSTFMIEMLETSSILATLTHNSLIIIDELGRGTSTYDGFGLAWSILEHLITQKNCFTLFATHFHELTELSSKYSDKVENLHVVAHVEKESDSKEDDITLMYKVEPGISDKSFGIHVAELVNFPSKIINMAKRKASELQSSNLNEEDKFIQNKKTKCSQEEINEGVGHLKSILKKWRTECYDENTRTLKLDSAGCVEKLKSMVESDFKDLIKEDKLINEVMTML